MYSREQLMDMIDNLVQNTSEYEMIESILYKNGASDDDSDPDEGYYAAMSDNQLLSAYETIINRLAEDASTNPEAYYLALSQLRNVTNYEQGWIDGYEAAMR